MGNRIFFSSRIASLNLIYSSLVVLLSLVTFSIQGFAQSIEQKLVVLRNDMTSGGEFWVGVQVKHTNLPVPGMYSLTLGLANIDVQFDPTKLNYIDSSNPAIVPEQGYFFNQIDNGSFIQNQVLIIPGLIPPFGYNISSSYTTWVQLNFIIVDAAGTTSLAIINGTNYIGVFENQGNMPQTGVINNVPLSPPVNIVDVALPVELSSFTAITEDNKVVLTWTTQSEINNQGFEVYRSTREDGAYALIASYENNEALQGAGNSNTERNYRYEDRLIAGGETYWYQIADVDYSGVRAFHGPVSAVAPEVIAERYVLHPNYPNPFNPETNIRFEIPANGVSSNVKLTVYNNLGMEVRSLINGSVEPGIHSLAWDGRNDSGKLMASGVYFLRLETGAFNQTRKMLLAR